MRKIPGRYQEHTTNIPGAYCEYAAFCMNKCTPDAPKNHPKWSPKPLKIESGTAQGLPGASREAFILVMTSFHRFLGP